MRAICGEKKLWITVDGERKGISASPKMQIMLGEHCRIKPRNTTTFSNIFRYAGNDEVLSDFQSLATIEKYAIINRNLGGNGIRINLLLKCTECGEEITGKK